MLGNQFTWMQPWLYDSKLHKIILVVFVFILYANTLGHQFVLDDGIVISENHFVKKGISGIPDILSTDSFYGFFKKAGKEKLVAGGRYRPMSMILFSFVYQVFGENPFIFHLFSILMYGLLGICIYLVFKSLFKIILHEQSVSFAFFTALLFVCHPVHTECVANIKGMDEITAMLFSMLALYFSILYLDQGKKNFLVGIGLSFLFGLLSKENAIAYLGIIPLAIYFLYKNNVKSVGIISSVLFSSTLIFLYMRSQILGFNPFSELSNELMNNPFMEIKNGLNQSMNIMDKAGLISYTLFEYIRLLIFPHPLTHDYYPKHIPVLGLFSSKSMLAILIYSTMIIFCVLKIKKYPVAVISILAFLFPLFLVSNILFPIGTNMGERFLFMPSIGFCIILAFIVIKKYSQEMHKSFFLLGTILILYSIKTISRNPAWHDNLTLFTTDVKTSVNSAKIHNGIAGVMLEKVPELKDSNEIKKITSKARIELNKALSIHPLYMESLLQMGNIHYYEKNYEAAIDQYNLVLNRLPEDEDAFKNLQMALRERGRQIGMQTGNAILAKDFLKQALGMNPKDVEAIMLMGIAEGSTGNFQDANKHFYKVLEFEPENAQAHFNIAITYKNTGEQNRADSMFKQAALLDPKIFEKNGMNTQ